LLGLNGGESLDRKASMNQDPVANTNLGDEQCRDWETIAVQIGDSPVPLVFNKSCRYSEAHISRA
jgi:hypothetical protein